MIARQLRAPQIAAVLKYGAEQQVQVQRVFPLITIATRAVSSISTSNRYMATSTSPPVPPAEESRPFCVLGLQQIAVGSLQKKSLSYLWQGIFGLEKSGTFQSKQENVDEDILHLGGGSIGSGGQSYENSLLSLLAVEVDLMTPLDPEASPKVHSPALNHIGLWVDDLEAAVSWMKDKGVRFTPGGIRKGASGHDVTFIHPKGSVDSPIGGEGVLIELVQAPPEVVQVFQK